MVENILRNIFMQIPFLITVRDDHNHTLFGNLVLARFAGLHKLSQLEGLSDFDAPWHNYADAYFKQDQDAFRDIVYRQFEPCMTAEGYKVLLVQKIPLKNDFNGVKAILGVAIEISDKDIVSTIHLIEKSSPLASGQVLVVSNQVYVKEKFPDLELSSKEIECIYHVLRGRSSKVIASYYNCSPKTIESRLDQLKLKFGCTSKQMLIDRLTEFGFMSMIPESILKQRLGCADYFAQELSASQF